MKRNKEENKCRFLVKFAKDCKFESNILVLRKHLKLTRNIRFEFCQLQNGNKCLVTVNIIYDATVARV